MLVERFGHVMAYWLVAGGLAVIGVIASIVVSVKEHEEEVAEQQAAKTDTEELVSDATAQALAQTPIALLGALMTIPGGAAGALSAARLLGRNWPLVLLLVMIGALFWPTEDAPAEEDVVVGTQAERIRRSHAQRAEALRVRRYPRGGEGGRTAEVPDGFAPLHFSK